jgi:RNA polymerase sigma factor (sigma-70 family)
MDVAATEPAVRAVAGTVRPLGREATLERVGIALSEKNPDAIREIESRLGPMIRRYVRRKYPRVDVDEVLQLTLIDIWRGAERFDPSRSLEAWALTIASRRAIDGIRRESRHTATTLDTVAEVAGEDGDETASRNADAEVVHNALAALPQVQQEVLRLAYIHDLTQTQIAEKLRIPLGTVKARTFRGLKALRKLLDGYSDHGPANA